MREFKTVVFPSSVGTVGEIIQVLLTLEWGGVEALYKQREQVF